MIKSGFKYMKKLSRGNKSQFDIPVDIQRAFLESLGEVHDDFDRSYKQYRCQNFFVPPLKKIVLELVSALVFPVFIIYSFLISRLLISKKVQVNALGEFKDLEDVVPEEISSKYEIDNGKWFKERGSLSLSDVRYIIKIALRFPFAPYMVLKLAVKISKYSSMYKAYAPVAFVVHNEYSFTSSILTNWCEKHGIDHIDAMHGEKLYFIRDSFFRYTKCYVWSNHYVQLLIDLKAEPKQFEIAIPPSMKIDLEKYSDPVLYADYKYYLGAQKGDKLKETLQNVTRILEGKGTLKFRPHPRYTDISEMLSLISEDKIEYPNKVSIQKSVANLKYAVGSYSTVLSQAYFSGREVILDDVTSKDQYIKLMDLRYILATKEIQKLSKINLYG